MMPAHLNDRGIPALAALTLLLAACSGSVAETPGVADVDGDIVTIDGTGTAPKMVVYKSPTCGCCSGWVEHMQRAGFDVDAIDTDDVESVKADNGLLDPSLKSCHTALIDGYLIEGHVPASAVQRLLRERPDVIGLTAPGMPVMSPGMGSETPKDYSVLTFDETGSTEVFERY